MSIERIEAVTYGVEDIKECLHFFTDFGLTPLESTPNRAILGIAAGQTLTLRHVDDPGLPPAVEPGSSIREVVWGVDTQDSLDKLVADLRTDRDVEVVDGVAHTHDETGYGLGLAVARPVAIERTFRKSNSTNKVERWNEPIESVGRVRPFRICHVALNIPKEGKEKAIAFYLDRLHFRATDVVKPMGTFMQCEGDADQHNLLLCHRPDRAGINHTSYEVAGFDDVIEGGNYMIAQGWQEARRLGRHTVGSNVFRFIHCPAGGRVEYAADMDRVDHDYETNVYEEAPPHHIWILRDSRENEASGDE